MKNGQQTEIYRQSFYLRHRWTDSKRRGTGAERQAADRKKTNTTGTIYPAYAVENVGENIKDFSKRFRFTPCFTPIRAVLVSAPVVTTVQRSYRVNTLQNLRPHKAG